MQVSNPFDDAQGQFYILQNARSAFSLWPQQCPLPAGWHPVCQPQPLEDCNTWLAQRWTTLMPGSYAGACHE
ncbi:MbtH family NRPS accessory protein [Pluralibacter gergoviae]|uniref:MbtH family NRPS accessory protein n=1 Tax=Pluralibacter gergoviae TaxID=61647 RepID=A0AAI9DIV7_PLUGE|nr:MbtH family NRPS accessory protein [Pluralibacter gergoviae]AIR02406.1 invasin [Pluralibacter gergoviae]AVR03306.1 MbtH family protein [Pluralibacter gergoviae]EKV0914493.1 MbtH family NRPS accessory protein [Pluralibacter gergoviae]EKV0928036.1 MbtH family NRPS accessory protein [Pluralibacter gergoviae]EKV6245972.1 MbtH family NRPS accessory protein [Pluralibacter gergoviae]